MQTDTDVFYDYVKRATRHIGGLILILVIASTLTGGIASFMLYNTALRQKSEFLLTEVRNLSRLIESVARFDRGTFKEVGKATRATLSQVEAAFRDQHGVGESGEILLGRRDGRKVVIFLRYRDNQLNENLILPREAARTEAMALALAGNTGVGRFSDFRGESVLAAYTYIASLQTAIEIKVAMSEIIRPYLYSGLLIALASAAVILICVFLFIRLSRPVLEELEQRRLLTEAVVDSAQDLIITIDDRCIIRLLNPMAIGVLGYDSDELPGRDFAVLFDPFDAATQKLIAQIRSGESENAPDGIVYLRKKNGAVFPASITIGQNKLKGRGITTIVVHDLSALKESEEKIRDLTHRMIEIKDQEQDAISKELHDTLGTNLVWLKMQAQRIFRSKNTDAADVDNLLLSFDETIDMTRNISQSLSPIAIEKIGLAQMLERLAERARHVSKAKVRFLKQNFDAPLPEKTSFHVFRIVQEALNNALKHAGAENIEISCGSEHGVFQVRVSDDGRGFDAHDRQTGMGLSLIAERARLLKGVVSISSARKKGTEVRVEFPFG